jgi:hydroxypyruvate isomerase
MYFSRSLALAICDSYHEQRGLPQDGGVALLLASLHGNVDLLELVHVADVPGRHAPGTGVIDYPAIDRGCGRKGIGAGSQWSFCPSATVKRSSSERRPKPSKGIIRGANHLR